eukprot:CAMPEP_0196655186 /NCGR_PEP_ID=MMETSP1086-20130531/4921_1 /TAXON_ID=77921 /ORGANISM="Cyanoptyche  gloeocystis , Strain SAG4.97" /LENGTH=162 /DNA_ID=CAMNT_0041987353 /DNA_START=74 /DNA_END=562 /DNA_ORIENTATION=-
MPHSYGYRARTRKVFARPFRQHGSVGMSTFLTNFKIGEYVDIKVNGSVHKGMPHKFYQGRTGVVWNVTKRAIGVEINKQVRNRIIRKRIHVRIDHVQKSKCRESFLRRVKENDKYRREAHLRGEKNIVTKRFPVGPTPGGIVKVSKDSVPETIHPVQYDTTI